jgi:hypothetical protein
MGLASLAAKQQRNPCLFSTWTGILCNVPLYACDRCGFASTAFRADAARAHQLDYPGCAGTIRMVLDPQAREAQLARSAIPGRRAPGSAQNRYPAHQLFVPAADAQRYV